MQLHYIALHAEEAPVDDQLTFRIPRTLARALARRAKERGVPKSQVVREALARYMVGEPAEPDREELWRRIQPFIGSIAIDEAAVEADEIARQIRRNNWRE